MEVFEFTCRRFKFIRFPNLGGFNAFDENGLSLGIDEVCKRIDELDNVAADQNSEIVRLKTIIDKFIHEEGDY